MRSNDRHLGTASACSLMLLLAGSALQLPVAVRAQRAPVREAPSRSAPRQVVAQQMKGVWEPINYSEDVALRDVFFVTAQKGWASGDNGTILRTSDGGDSWSPQLGGTAGSGESPIWRLRFIDERIGWALDMNGKLLRTTDGESWVQVGTSPAGGYADYEFTSRRNGVMLGVDVIHHTTNGGRSWRDAMRCALKVRIEGLPRDVTCHWVSLTFPSATTGYAVSRSLGPSVGFVMAKTENGGATWTTWVVPMEIHPKDGDMIFTDDRTGLLRTHGALYRTTDGGRSWLGVVASPLTAIKFADPQVGWTFGANWWTLIYTTNGGTRWSNAEVRFPAPVWAFSLPRRDRGYVVGEHGMIYRYRLAPVTVAAAPQAMPAPAMPSFETPLDEQVAELAEFVERLESSVNAMPESAAGTAAAATVEVVTVPAGGAEQAGAGADASAFARECCGKSLSRWQLAFVAVQGILPQFLGQFRNTNLLLAGLRMMTELPEQLSAVQTAYGAFGRSQNKEEAKANIAALAAAVASLKSGTAVALQREPAPESLDAGATTEAIDAQPSGSAASSAARPGSSAPPTASDTTDMADKAAEAVKKAAADALKKRIRFP